MCFSLCRFVGGVYPTIYVMKDLITANNDDLVNSELLTILIRQFTERAHVCASLCIEQLLLMFVH